MILNPAITTLALNMTRLNGLGNGAVGKSGEYTIIDAIYMTSDGEIYMTSDGEIYMCKVKEKIEKK